MSSLNKFLLFLIGVLFIAGQFFPFSASSVEDTTLLAAPTATPTPTPIPVASPMNFSIPRLGINASVEPVSVDFDGRMNMPEDYAKVAWYSLGYKPGEKGNAVIAGHLDTTAGTPALFYNLSQLEIGDEVSVTAADGKLYTFIIFDKQVYEFDKAPISEIFGSSDYKQLNLMTCTGLWNQATHNYSHRTVIYTRLKES